jgi:hypothetical protein
LPLDWIWGEQEFDEKQVTDAVIEEFNQFLNPKVLIQSPAREVGKMAGDRSSPLEGGALSGIVLAETAHRAVLGHLHVLEDSDRVPGGPESLVIDQARRRAFTNLWDGVTVAIEIE